MPPICIYTEVVQAAGNTNYLSWVSAINQAFFNSLLSVRFCLSFNPSIWKFSKDWLISFFSETQHDVRGPCAVVCDRARLFEKKYVCPKNWENGPEMRK